MRVPFDVPIIRRRATASGAPGRVDRAEPHGTRPYQQELEARRRQERADELLARRMQLAALNSEPENSTAAASRTRQRPNDSWGIGNAGTHFMNDDFIQNAANIVLGALGDGHVGRRGERASTRQHPPSRDPGTVRAQAVDAGLVPDAFGTQSVLGAAANAAPASPRTGTVTRRAVENVDRKSRSGKQPYRTGAWLEKVG